MQNKSKFVELMGGMATVYKTEVSDALADMYWKIFEQYTDEQFAYACERWIHDGKFFPKPADLIEYIEASAKERAEAAADRVLDANRHGRELIFDNPVTEAVVQRVYGGMERLGATLLTKNIPFWRKEFIERFMAYEKNGVENYGLPCGVKEVAGRIGCPTEQNPGVALLDDGKEQEE